MRFLFQSGRNGIEPSLEGLKYNKLDIVSHGGLVAQLARIEREFLISDRTLAEALIRRLASLASEEFIRKSLRVGISDRRFFF